MTSTEFILWLQGFTQGVHEYNISPKQWDALKDKLAEVNDDSRVGVSILAGETRNPNAQPFPIWQEPHYVSNGIAQSDEFVITSTTYAPLNGVSYTFHNED